MRHDDRDDRARKGSDRGRPGSRYLDLKGMGPLPGLSLVGSEELLRDGVRVLERTASDDEGLSTLLGRLMRGLPTPLPREDLVELLRTEADLCLSSAVAFRVAAANRVGRCEEFQYDAFWSHSLARAVAAEHLARELGHEESREVFLTAFFWRIGALALSGAFPDAYASVLTGSDVDSLEALRSLEQKGFGIDHLALSEVLFERLGFTDTCRGHLRHLVSGVQEHEGVRVLRYAERVAEICVLDEESREQRWLELVDIRRELGLERDTFSAMGDAIVRSWWEWGEALEIPTRPVTSFYALDQTAMLERKALSLPKLRTRVETTGPLRVLVVDDDPTTVAILRTMLRKGGHEVITATDGEEALQAVLQSSPEVVVADWVMPEMDGLELCRALRRYEAGRNVFFVLLTGRDEEEHVVGAFEAGVDDFLSKPTSEGFLLARMTAARRVIQLREQVRMDQRILKQQLVKMSFFAGRWKETMSTDALTELPNRRYAVRRMQEEWSSSERSGLPLSLVMMDVDHFKGINDEYGHDVGDLVLRAVADVLEDVTRRDEVACRFGGEEFIVICRDTNAEEAYACGERIREAIAERVVENAPFDDPVTVSVGVATRTLDMEGIEDLIKASDRMVYRAKDSGRNRTCRESAAELRECGTEVPRGNSEKDWPRGSSGSEGDEAA